MRINELIRILHLIYQEHGDIEISKSVIVKDNELIHKRIYDFLHIEPKLGTIEEVTKLPHNIFRHKITREPIIFQANVTNESKMRFTYNKKRILTL